MPSIIGLGSHRATSLSLQIGLHSEMKSPCSSAYLNAQENFSQSSARKISWISTHHLDKPVSLLICLCIGCYKFLH